MDSVTAGEARSWTVFSSHGLVLLYLAGHPDSTLRLVSDALGFTERQISRIVKDLVSADMVEVARHGRRQTYTVRADAALRHPSVRHVTVGRILVAMRAGTGR